jgi:hypothetical protein
MDLDFYSIHLPLKDPPSADAIREIFENCFDAGWTTTRDGRTDECLYTYAATDTYLEWRSTDQALSNLAANQRGAITIFGSHTDFSISVSPSWESNGYPEFDGVSLTWERVHFREDVEEATNELFDATALVYDVLEPPFAHSYLPYEFEYETSVTHADFDARCLPDIYWLMFVREADCEWFDREQLQESPVWKVETVGDETVGVVVTSNPRGGYTQHDKARLKAAIGLYE